MIGYREEDNYINHIGIDMASKPDMSVVAYTCPECGITENPCKHQDINYDNPTDESIK